MEVIFLCDMLEKFIMEYYSISDPIKFIANNINLFERIEFTSHPENCNYITTEASDTLYQGDLGVYNSTSNVMLWVDICTNSHNLCACISVKPSLKKIPSVRVFC